MLHLLISGSAEEASPVTVFVSYSSRDRDAVKSLVQDLQDADEQVWMDQRLAGGEAWWRAILDQIRGCGVFIFALSQRSIESKPCEAELHYAQALGLPILPVQVGPVDSMQLNPLATVQAIDYRHSTPNSGVRLIAALHRERARRQPLPEPLPDEPPVPFEYLIRLFTTISNPDYLSPPDQAALVAQLQFGLREDGQHEAARNDILTLLRKLRDREDITHRTLTEVDAILASIDTESPLEPPIATDAAPAVESAIIDDAAKASSQTVAPTEQAAPADGPPVVHDKAASPAPAQPAPPPQPIPPTPTRVGGISRRTTIALIAGAIALVAVIAAAVGIPALVKHRPAQTSQIVLPFTGLNNPNGVAAGAAGAVYVADTANNRVVKFVAGSATPTVLPFTGLYEPFGVAVDSTGTLYVTDSGNNRVLRLAAGASTQDVLPFTGLQQPTGVAVDTAGDVYVGDGGYSGNTRMVKLAAGSTTQTVLPSDGAGWGVAVDTAGNVYVTDGGENGRVLKLAAGSATPTVLPFTGLNVPFGVAVDAAGAVYVADTNNARVVKLALGSSTQTVLPFTGLGQSRSVAVDTAGSVYVVDNHQVLKLAVQ
jgi:sugar lactone lactonase YvrE